MFQESFKGVSKLCLGCSFLAVCFKDITRCVKQVVRVSQGYVKSVSRLLRKFQGLFNHVSRGFILLEFWVLRVKNSKIKIKIKTLIS